MSTELSGIEILIIAAGIGIIAAHFINLLATARQTKRAIQEANQAEAKYIAYHNRINACAYKYGWHVDHATSQFITRNGQRIDINQYLMYEHDISILTTNGQEANSV